MMMTTPTLMNCQNGATLMNTRPYWMTAMTRAPATVPRMVPDPPKRLAPPMTTAAMVFGMLPLALALNDGGDIQAPMGRAIIGGVITSTILTLVVVPVLYSYLVRDKKKRPVAEGGGVMPAVMPADRE